MFRATLNLIDRLLGRLRYGSPRSSEWSKVRNDYLEKHPTCAVCGTNKKCEVHHIFPYHLKPELELNQKNLITLCRPHHLLFGHLMSWKSFNKKVISDTQTWKKKVANR